MSTYWGYVCKDHNPPLESEHWLNHGEYVLIDTLRSVRAGHWPKTEWGDLQPLRLHDYDWHGPIQFLTEHPNCIIALGNEYGDEQPIEGQA